MNKKLKNSTKRIKNKKTASLLNNSRQLTQPKGLISERLKPDWGIPGTYISYLAIDLLFTDPILSQHTHTHLSLIHI